MHVVRAVFRLCSSYPQKLLVPIWITDKELESVASFRSWKRIPVVVYRWVYWPTITCVAFCFWVHGSVFVLTDSLCLNFRHQKNGAVIARCSQPEISWWGWRNTDDEYLVTSIAKACQMGTKSTCGAPACRQRGEAPDSCDSDFGKEVERFIYADSCMHCYCTVALRLVICENVLILSIIYMSH